RRLGRRRRRPRDRGGAERREQLAALHAAQLEDQERIAVELLAEQVVDRGDVLAGVRVVGARAGGLEVAARVREQRQALLFEHLLDALGDLTHAELDRDVGPLRERARELLPVGARQHREVHAHEIRCIARSLDVGGDEALADLDVDDVALARVVAAAPEPAPDREPLEHFHPPAPPPVLARAPAPRALIVAALRAAVTAAAPALRAAAAAAILPAVWSSLGFASLRETSVWPSLGFASLRETCAVPVIGPGVEVGARLAAVRAAGRCDLAARGPCFDPPVRAPRPARLARPPLLPRPPP